MSEYVVHHLNDDGTDGAVIGTAASVEEARELGDEQAADPNYPWYRIYRDGKHVETVQAYPADYYDPERAGIPPVPTPEQRAAWPRPVDRSYRKALLEDMKDHDPPL